MPEVPYERQILHRSDLDALFAALESDGRVVFGPTTRDGAVVLDRLASAADLPAGVQEAATPGRYRLEKRDDLAVFAHTVGPDAPKRVLWPPRLELFRARRQGEGFAIEAPAHAPARLALIGARACELAAIAIQDRVLLESAVPDPSYASRREDLFIVAAQCFRAADTCFCPSMGTGPRVTQGYDLCLTEIVDATSHRFVVEIGSEAGAAVASQLPLAPLVLEDAEAPEEAAAAAESQIARRMPVEGLRERLLDALESPRWDAVAERCLGCASCTMVCPTCFCTTVEDHTLLTGEAVRTRRWDSCFDPAFTHVHGGEVRPSLGARYRQWLTHKLATWHDQFGTSGCVGCGRCIAWCPAGIDIVEEASR